MRANALAIGIAAQDVPEGFVMAAALLLPWGLGFAAGAMLFVISPESHREGHEVFATAGLMIGFVVMMVLDTALA